MKKILYLLMGIGLIAVGCDNTTGTTDTAEIESTLTQLLDSDEFIAFVGFDDDGVYDMDYSSGIEEEGGIARILADTLWPENDQYRIRFGRTKDSLSRVVDWEIDEENGVAFAHISRTVFGKLRIVAIDSNYAVVDSFVKPFESVFNQSVRFIKNDNENGHPWFVDAFTIGHGKTGDKVGIQHIAAYRPNSTTPDYAYGVNDLGEVYIPRDSVPTFTFRTPVRIELTVTNTGPEFPYKSGEAVLLQYGKGRHEKGRRKLSDNGVWPDETANDNVFTRIWPIHGPGYGRQQRVFMAWFDVIDFGTLFAEDEAVHSELWRLPYRSVRP